VFASDNTIIDQWNFDGIHRTASDFPILSDWKKPERLLSTKILTTPQYY